MVNNKYVRIMMILFIIYFNIFEIESDSEMPSIDGGLTKNGLTDEKLLKYNTVLRVAPFPYLPDPWDTENAHLLQFIKDEFESSHPGIQLVLRPMNTSEDFYDLPFLTKLLSTDASGYDIVEIDTVLLGDLVDLGLVTPQTNYSQGNPAVFDWHPAAFRGVQVNHATYAFPHIMCGYCLFTHGDIFDRNIINSVDDLDKYLNPKNSMNGILSEIVPYRIVGNLDSSWDLTAMWISSQLQKRAIDLSDEVVALHEYEHLSFENIRKFARLCNVSSGQNPCLDGTFATDYEKAATLFANYKARALFGYSERLFYILKNGPASNLLDVKIQPLPLGDYMLARAYFTDAYVFRRKLSPEKLAAANAFVNFMATPRMQAAVVANEEFSNTKLYRYLLPMTKSAYGHQAFRHDRFYIAYLSDPSGNLFSYPNTGFLKTHRQLVSDIKKYIANP